MNYGYRALQDSDAPWVSDILRAAFDPSLHPYIAYCQPGLRYYLGDEKQHAGRNAGTVIERVATDSAGRVVGYAKVTRNDPELPTLSYLAVDTSHRRRGIAGRLISSAADGLGDCNLLCVDVFSDNHRALAFYQRLAAAPLTRTNWWAAVRRSVAVQPSSDAIVENSADVRMRLDRYGFGQATVLAGGHRQTFNIPSRSVLRLPNVDTVTLENSSAVTALTPIETLLAMSEESPESSCGGAWHHIVGSVRLRFRLPVRCEPHLDS